MKNHEEINIIKLEIENPSIFEIYSNNKSILRFDKNGDIFVKEKLIENDKEIVNGFREFLKQQGCIN